MEEDECFKCNLCFFNTKFVRKFSNHYVRYHKNDPGVSVSCGVGACGDGTLLKCMFIGNIKEKRYCQ